MSVLNSAKVIGRLTKEVEINDSGELTILRNSVAVNRDFKNKDGDYDADFIPFVAFGKTAEFIEKFFNKGDAIAIDGSIRTGSYTNKDGNKVYTTEIAVEKASFVPGSKKSSEESVEEEPKKKTSSKKAKKAEKDDEDFMNIEEAEDLPF